LWLLAKACGVRSSLMTWDCSVQGVILWLTGACNSPLSNITFFNCLQTINGSLGVVCFAVCMYTLKFRVTLIVYRS
jgi:hypothetical protein